MSYIPITGHRDMRPRQLEHMLAFGFHTLTLHRVWAQCLAENRASVRVIERLGDAPKNDANDGKPGCRTDGGTGSCIP